MDSAPVPDDYKDKYLRALADLENLRKRTQREVAAAHDQAENHAISEFLPLVDDFKRALEWDANTDVTRDQAREGWQLVFKKLGQVLERLEIQGFESVGRSFTADLMEAVTQVSVPTLPAGTVVDELEQGFTRRGKLLRPAKVTVASKEQPHDP
jgi:molecular chaperone GrpE